MRTQLHGSTQRRQLLTDQLAAAGKAIAAHSIKEPDFGKRKAEHEILASKIAALRQVYGLHQGIVLPCFLVFA